MRVPAKEKAIELVGSFYSKVFYFEVAKDCALFCIDKILEAIDWHEFEAPNKEYMYWGEVKEEIKKM